jgi:hypothetical protein
MCRELHERFMPDAVGTRNKKDRPQSLFFLALYPQSYPQERPAQKPPFSRHRLFYEAKLRGKRPLR